VVVEEEEDELLLRSLKVRMSCCCGTAEKERPRTYY
jgi:hypothetical protein